MEISLDQPILIYQDHENIDFFKKIIEEQSIDLYNEKISNYLKKFDYGFLILGKLKYVILKGFILFRYEEFGSTIISKIFYVSNLNFLSKLLDSVLEFISNKKIESWVIFLTNNSRLIKFYENIGFKIVRKKNKSVEIRKDFTYYEEIETQFELEEF